MSQVPNVLFPYNGHYFTFEAFAKAVERMIAEAKVYETNTARPVSSKVRKQIISALTEHLRRSGE